MRLKSPPVGRMAPTVLVIVLLGGTATAFAVAERLKLEKSPITGPRVTKAFSPGCDCPKPFAHISFRIAKPDTISATVVDSDGEPVRTLARRMKARGRVELRWDGRTGTGNVVPDADYYVRVVFAKRDRTIDIPHPMRVDTVAPRIRIVSALPRSVHGGSRVKVRYRISERGQALLLVDGRRRVVGRRFRPRGELDWYAKARGEPLRSGVYELALRARDRAGNFSPTTAPVEIRVGRARI